MTAKDPKAALTTGWAKVPFVRLADVTCHKSVTYLLHHLSSFVSGPSIFDASGPSLLGAGKFLFCDQGQLCLQRRPSSAS